MTKHTPGPWRDDGDEFDIYQDGTNKPIANVHEITTNEGEANARVIAAAPDLLAAAKQALDFIQSLPYEPSNAASTKAQDALVDTIAKATKS